MCEEKVYTNTNNIEIKKGHTYIQWIVALIANSSLMTYGLQAGWISPMTQVLQSSSSPTGTSLSNESIGWIASIMPITAMLATPLYSFIADKYGRKVGILLVALPHAMCWLIKIFIINTVSLVIARICCGIAAGGCFNVISMYTKEISQDDIRGNLGSLLMLFHNVGIFGMYALGAYFDYYTVLYIVVGLPILSFALILKCPESPGYLLKVGKYDAALQVMSVLRGLPADDKSINNELDAMKKEDEYFKTLPTISMLTILKNKPWRKAYILSALIISVQTFSGNFAIVTYGASILAAAGATMNPELLSLSFPTVLIIGSILSLAVVEKIGRKVILGGCLILETLSQLTMGIVLLVLEMGGSVPVWLPITAVIGSMFGYAAGVLPVPYIVMSEMFNIQIRAKLLGVVVAQSWLMTFIQLATFAPVSDALGMYTAFFFFSFINFCGVLIVYFMMPETRGKTVAQIEDDLILKK